ncbi:unnamed protein product [Closterium sp. Naga37s-1]|nr:unnamed protein product [Closterium sp. Naga37s-1]
MSHKHLWFLSLLFPSPLSFPIPYPPPLFPLLSLPLPIPPDACAIGEADSAFLQQAAFLTGGLYLHSSRPNALLQDLLLVFGVDQFSRDFITLPQPSAVDFRASCFCHKRPVDMGFVCSVCLSIFCSPARTCATCG